MIVVKKKIVENIAEPNYEVADQRTGDRGGGGEAGRQWGSEAGREDGRGAMNYEVGGYNHVTLFDDLFKDLFWMTITFGDDWFRSGPVWSRNGLSASVMKSEM